MIAYTGINIMDSQADALVVPTNVRGVMGAGLAKAFREKYPAMFQTYKRACADGSFGLGQILPYREGLVWIVCLPTKKHWAEPSTVAYIESGLKAYVEWAKGTTTVMSHAFPMLGCGLGRLPWDEVRPVMERHLGQINGRVNIHIEPDRD